MKKRIFTGSGVAIVTPFNEDMTIDFGKLGELIDFNIINKTDCIVICGTTGESSTMTQKEHLECISYAVKHTNGRVPVIAGTGSNSTAEAVEYTKEAFELGAEGALVVTPYYNKTSQEGLYRHYMTVADCCGIPLIVYNVPSRTGLDITPETYARLSAHPNINGIKEANGNIQALIRTVDLCGDNINIYSGEDGMIIPVLSVGGAGVISVLANLCPRETHDMCGLWFDGRTDEAARLQIKYAALVAALFSDVNPIPVKTAMELMGLCSGRLRQPLCEMGSDKKEKLRLELKKQGLIK